MSDSDALIAAILANPDEDTPRLAFADWLDEHGDPARAEFIRVQIELARLREAARDLPDSFGDERTEYVSEGQNQFSFAYCRHHNPGQIELLRREAELLAHSNNREAWRSGLPKYATDSGASECVFRRGFVGRVRVSLAAMLKDPKALWEHHSVEALALTAVTGRTTTAKVPRSAFLARVRELSFPYTGGNFPLLEPFARCPHLAGLRSLLIDASALSEGDANTLAKSEHLRPAHFNFKASGLPRAAFEALVNSPFASQLRELTAESAGEWALEVAAAAPLDGLRQLHLEYAGCGDAGVVALTRSKHLTDLVTLGLGSNQLTNAATEALAAWPGLASVRALDLTDADITGTDLEALVASPYFRPAYLKLFSTAVGDIGAVALAQWPGLANLRVLDLRYAQVCDTGGLALARSPHWRDIRCLMLTPDTFRRAHGPLHERFGGALSTSY